MDTTDARTAAATCARGGEDRDLATVRGVLADDVSFRGPPATPDDVDDRAGVRRAWPDGARRPSAGTARRR
jgi:hypothetical protein